MKWSQSEDMLSTMGRIFSDVSLETVIDAGGVEKWAAAARNKAAEDNQPTTEQRSRAQMMMATAGMKGPQLALGGAGTTAPKNFYPMLKARDKTKIREANVFNMFVSRSM